jgi:diaminopimelate decarboxylase
MEINIRLPAWIHGASVCGANLPVALVDGVVAAHPRMLAPGFTRVVEEIAVREALGIVSFPWASDESSTAAVKHPSDMPGIGRRHLLKNVPHAERSAGPTAHDESRGSLDGLPTNMESLETPFRLLLPERFVDQVGRVKRELASLGEITLAQSIKTCPEPRILGCAAALGMVAETITQDELKVARRHGFASADAILNGPAKWWPKQTNVECDAFFVDSISEFYLIEDMLDRGFELQARIVGVRISPVTVRSRFGVHSHDLAQLRKTAHFLTRLTARLDAAWGIHFHFAESILGAKLWTQECAAAFRIADILGEHLGSAPAMLDFGGGWHPDDLDLLQPSLATVMANGPESVESGQVEWVLEPGKLLTQCAGAMLTRVLVDAYRSANRDVIVDAGLNDIPEAPYWRHPVAVLKDGSWRSLEDGDGRILGRTCMEADVLAHGLNTESLRRGEMLAFSMSGAYDASMAYDFGRGQLAVSSMEGAS